MYTVTWIESNRLHSISSPSVHVAHRLHWLLLVKAGRCVRLWHTAPKQAPALIF